MGLSLARAHDPLFRHRNLCLPKIHTFLRHLSHPLRYLPRRMGYIIDRCANNICGQPLPRHRRDRLPRPGQFHYSMVYHRAITVLLGDVCHVLHLHDYLGSRSAQTQTQISIRALQDAGACSV